MKVIDGNIFSTNCQALVNSVNCVGVMGKGLALECHLRFGDDYFNRFKQDCEDLKIRPGVLTLWAVSSLWWNENLKYIVNFPSKDHWQNPAKIEYIEEGMGNMLEFVKENSIESIALPLLGVNLGGLDEKLVVGVMEKYLEQLQIKYEVYKFNINSHDLLFNRFEKNFSGKDVEFYKKNLRITRNVGNIIKNELDNGNLNSMSDLNKLEGVGVITLKRIYSFIVSRQSVEGLDSFIESSGN